MVNVNNIISAYYKDKMKDSEPDYRVHGWESEEAVRERYEVLFRAVDLNGKSLLDAGCGTGALLDEIRNRKIRCCYLGIDILPEMVTMARKRRPDGSFLCLDLSEENPFDRNCFDVVYASGMFNLNTGDNEALLAQLLPVFTDIASECVVFNLLHERSQNREETYFYSSPRAVEHLLRRARIRPRSVDFIDGYRQNDFSVVLRLS